MKNVFAFMYMNLFISSGFAQQATPEIFATTPHAVGNITFDYKGQLIFSYHPFFSPGYRVARYDEATKTITAFPDKSWNMPRETDDYYLSSVLGVRNDKNGIVWMLDMGQQNSITPKIVGWNTSTDSLQQIYYIPAPASIPVSQLNDFVVDLKHHVFIIADEGIGNGGDGSKAALVVVDMKTSKCRRVLQGHWSTKPENKPVVIDGKTLSVNNKPIMVGTDGITADNNDEWLYYAPMCGSKIYRVKTADVINDDLPPTELSNRIETYAEKPNNGGLSIDKDNNLYLTAIETKTVGVITANNKKYRSYISDKKMLWPDGVSYNSVDGYMYVSAAQVHLGAVFNNGTDKTTAPFYILRFKPVVEGVFGR